MTSPKLRVLQAAASSAEAELLARGLRRRFFADEPRLLEAVELYRELGLEVTLLPVVSENGSCTDCLMQDPQRYRVIYTRKAQR